MKIGIIGGGTVGRAIARTYLEFVDEVRVWDKLPERSTHGFEDTILANVIFVCLSTPEGPDGRLDCSALHSFFSRLASLEDSNYVLKSTVPIGTTRELKKKYGLTNLVHSPEFLTARCADTDSMIPACNIIGMPCKGGKILHGYPNPECVDQLKSLYESRFPGIPCKVVTSDESEAIKLFTNGFYAVKVAYFNEIRCLADKLNLNWDTVVAGMLSQGRIAPYHYQVPGRDGYGYQGSCLPKDISELMHELGENAYVTKGAVERNKEDIKRGKDR